VTLVLHDWGSALGFDWAYRHPEAVKGIAYMEAIVKPGTWSDLPDQARQVFQALRTPAGEQMILQENRFIEYNLPATLLRKLSDEEMAHYRKPFLAAGEGRRPMLSWARQLPFDGDPADITQLVTTYGEWLAHSSIPKLFIRAEPGLMAPAAAPIDAGHIHVPAGMSFPFSAVQQVHTNGQQGRTVAIMSGMQ
jgi:haloalkane dehalogenase